MNMDVGQAAPLMIWPWQMIRADQRFERCRRRCSKGKNGNKNWMTVPCFKRQTREPAIQSQKKPRKTSKLTDGSPKGELSTQQSSRGLYCEIQ